MKAANKEQRQGLFDYEKKISSRIIIFNDRNIIL